jgi:D-aspartate ligase
MNTLMSAAAADRKLAPPDRQNSAKRAMVPAILLGGGANALSAARVLGRAGVPIYVVNEPDSLVRHSRYGRFVNIPVGVSAEQAWTDYLLGSASDSLRGAVLLACCDHALTILARHHTALARKFLLDDVNPEARVAMLNKIDSYQIAAAAGVSTPRFWVLAPGQPLDSAAMALPYPLIVKPTHTHVFRQKVGKKFIIAHDFASLRHALAQVSALQMETMLVEFIPGRDDQLCSYYTYLDENGAPLFHFTKRVIRRYPLVVGNGCYHITDWNPEVTSAGLAFLQAARVRGLGSVEFKRDPRDGKLKLIECNARFTEANCLLAAAGLDLPLFVYNRLVGHEHRPFGEYRRGLRLWYPLEDFYAFRRLHSEGQLTWREWLRSVAHWQTLPYFRWYDPWPSVVREWRRIRAGLARRIGRSPSGE